MAINSTAIEKDSVGNQGTVPNQVAVNCMTQLSAGPGLLLYTVMDKVMVMCNDIQKQASKSAQIQIGLGFVENKAQQTATLASAKATMQQSMMQAGQSFAGAAVSGAQLFANGFGENSALRGKASEENVKLAKLNKLAELKADPLKNCTAGADLPESGGTPATKEAEINARKADLLKDFGTNGAGSEHDQDAINAMNTDEHRTFQEGLKKEIKLGEERIRGYHSEIQNNLSIHSTYGSFANGVKDGAFNVGQGAVATAKGQADADVAAAQYGAQVAQTNEGVAASQLSDWYKKIEAVVAAMHQGSTASAQ